MYNFCNGFFTFPHARDTDFVPFAIILACPNGFTNKLISIVTEELNSVVNSVHCLLIKRIAIDWFFRLWTFNDYNTKQRKQQSNGSVGNKVIHHYRRYSVNVYL